MKTLSYKCQDGVKNVITRNRKICPEKVAYDIIGGSHQWGRRQLVFRAYTLVCSDYSQCIISEEILHVTKHKHSPQHCVIISITMPQIIIF